VGVVWGGMEWTSIRGQPPSRGLGKEAKVKDVAFGTGECKRT